MMPMKMAFCVATVTASLLLVVVDMEALAVVTVAVTLPVDAVVGVWPSTNKTRSVFSLLRDAARIYC